MFKPTALYVKTHNQTGLKYFGKTNRLDCIHTYKGSGVHWRRHLKVHGCDYTTELLGIWQDQERLTQFAVKFCEENDVVKSQSWANMVLEEGLQGASSGETNVSKRADVRAKMSQNHARANLGKFNEKSSAFKGWYVTPLGKFASLREAGIVHKRAIQTIYQNVHGYTQKHGTWIKHYPPKEGWSFEPKGE